MGGCQRVVAMVGVGESGMWWHVSTKDLFLYVDNTHRTPSIGQN